VVPTSRRCSYEAKGRSLVINQNPVPIGHRFGDFTGRLEFVPAQGRTGDRVNLILLFLLAFALRLGLAAWNGLNRSPVGDAGAHYAEAVGLLEGKGLQGVLPNGTPCPSAFKMPLTSLVLAGGMTLFGKSPLVATLVAIGCGSLAAPLLYLTARTLMPPGWAILAGLGGALQPVYFIVSIQTLTEPFYVPLLLLATLLSVWAIQRPGFATAFIDGVAWGLAALCKPQAVPAALLVAFGLGLALKSWRSPLCLILGAALVMTPWWVRNFNVFGRPILLCLEGGETFLGANNPFVATNPDFAGMWLAPMSIPEYRARMLQCKSEAEVNDTLMEIGLDYLKGHPRVIPGLILKKWARWLTPVTASGGLGRLILLCSYGGLLMAVLLGLVLGKIRYSPLLISTLAITLTDFAVVGLYWGNLTRGRIPLEFTWLPWGVQSLRLLVGLPIADWYRRRLAGA
jgi:hypothetical protein